MGRGTVTASASGGPARPSFERWSLYAVSWSMAVVLAVTVVAVSAQSWLGYPGHTLPVSFVVLMPLVLLGELVPVHTASGRIAEGMLVSTSFALAVLFVWGLFPAVAVAGGASFVAQLVRQRAVRG